VCSQELRLHTLLGIIYVVEMRSTETIVGEPSLIQWQYTAQMGRFVSKETGSERVNWIQLAQRQIKSKNEPLIN
jgi:hypothetical protein